MILRLVYFEDIPTITEKIIRQAGDLVGKSKQQYSKKDNAPIEIIWEKIDFEKNKFRQIKRITGKIKNDKPTQPNSLIHSRISLWPYPISGM